MSDKATNWQNCLLGELTNILDEMDIFDPKAAIITNDGPVLVIVDKDADMMVIKLDVKVVEDEDAKIIWSALMNEFPEWSERT